MFKLKNTNILYSFQFLLALVMAVAIAVPVLAATTPAGCPGGPAGPPVPGAVCPDGSIVPDGSLPIGCPGSTQQGPVAPNYTVLCPARPGRSACTYDATAKTCLNAAGQDVMAGDSAASTPGRYSGSCTSEQRTRSNCAIVAIAVDVINLLSALVGIVIVLMIAVGGVQYSSSRDNPQATQAAKNKIKNALLALVAYLFMYALLQYLIPGGVL